MSDMRINGLSFDRGIDGIAYAGKDSGMGSLPDRQDLAPSTTGVKPQLSQLLERPNTERYLEEALKPAISNPELLIPAKFSQTLDQALSQLSQNAESAGEDSRVLNRAVRLLREETNLRELVAMYRHALFQG